MAFISRLRSVASEEKAAENQPELDLQAAAPAVSEPEAAENTGTEEKPAKVVRRRRIVVKNETPSEEPSAVESPEKQPESYESAAAVAEPASFE